VATSTVLTERPFMHVVFLMAPIARLGQLDFRPFFQRVLMTLFARQLFMGAIQSEFGLPIVIKRPNHPPMRGVT